jgi:hypothetical protein
MCDHAPEIGYNYLNTAFTGTHSTALSGSDDPELAGLFSNLFATQNGVASSLEQTELKSYFIKNDCK